MLKGIFKGVYFPYSLEQGTQGRLCLYIIQFDLFIIAYITIPGCFVGIGEGIDKLSLSSCAFALDAVISSRMTKQCVIVFINRMFFEG